MTIDWRSSQNEKLKFPKKHWWFCGNYNNTMENTHMTFINGNTKVFSKNILENPPKRCKSPDLSNVMNDFPGKKTSPTPGPGPIWWGGVMGDGSRTAGHLFDGWWVDGSFGVHATGPPPPHPLRPTLKTTPDFRNVVYLGCAKYAMFKTLLGKLC